MCWGVEEMPVGMYSGKAWQFFKVKNSFCRGSNATPGCTPTGVKRGRAQMQARLRSQPRPSPWAEREATPVSIHGPVDKQNVASTRSGIVFGPEKEGHWHTDYTKGEPWGHSAQWNKPVTTGPAPCDPTSGAPTGVGYEKAKKG